MSGFVSFISAGPGDPELLTLKGAARLREADVVLYDDLASGAILAHSIVDYPLRTSAIAALFAACVAMMAQAQARSAAPAKQRADEPRHVRIA